MEKDSKELMKEIEETSPPFDKQQTINMVKWMTNNIYINTDGLNEKFLYDKDGKEKPIKDGKVNICFSYLHHKWFKYLSFWNSKYSGYSQSEERYIKAEEKLMSFYDFISNQEEKYYLRNWHVPIKKSLKWITGNRT